MSATYYEAALLLSAEVQEKELASRWKTLASEVEKAGGIIKKEVKPFGRNLAYPIKKGGAKTRRAYLGTFYLEGKKEGASIIKALQELFKNQSEVIRFMISSLGAIPAETQRVIPAQREARRQATKEELVEKQEAKKPSLEELDKKLEEIMGDKISF